MSSDSPGGEETRNFYTTVARCIVNSELVKRVCWIMSGVLRASYAFVLDKAIHNASLILKETQAPPYVFLRSVLCGCAQEVWKESRIPYESS